MATFDAILKKSGLYTPDEYEKKAGDIETARRAAVSPFIDRIKARSAQGEAAASKVRSVQAPEAPLLEKLPDQPDFQFRDPLQAVGSLGTLLAVIGSLRTRAPMTASMNAIAGAVQGFHEGDKEVIALEHTKWKDSLDRAVRQNDQELKEYGAALQKANFNLSQAQAEFHSIAAQNGDDKMLAALESGNFEKQQHILDQRQNLGEKLASLHEQDALRRLQIQSMADYRAAALKARSGGPVDDATLKGRASMLIAGVPPSLAVPGYGGGAAEQRKQAQQAAISILMESGMSAEQAGQHLAQATLKYKATGGAVNLLEKLKASNSQIIKQLDFNASKTSEQMKKLERSDISPVVNAIANGADYWSGDPELAPLFYYMQGAAMEGARLQAGAGASVAQLHAETVLMAKKWSDQNMTPAMWDKIAEAMKTEGAARQRFSIEAIESELSDVGTPKPRGGARLRFDAQGNPIQ